MVELFCNIKDCSPLPGQKAPRTRRREERKGKKEKFSYRLSLIDTEVKVEKQDTRGKKIEDLGTTIYE